MDDRVKRVYRQDARAAASQRTRRAIVEAAAALFVTQGYGVTTVDQIAEHAGVGRRTVFDSVGGKLGALTLALDWAVTGDDADVPLRDREVIDRMRVERDPVRFVALWAGLITQIGARLAPLSRVLSAAADQEPDVHVLRTERQRQRLIGQRAFARGLDALGALNPALSITQAADELWLFSDPLLYDRLVHDRGWSRRRFETWLARTVTASILSDPSAGPGAASR